MTIVDVSCDDPRWLDLHNEVLPASALTAGEARAWHGELRGAWLLAADGGAAASVAVEPGLPDGVAAAVVLVRPTARGEGRGGALLAALRERAEPLGMQALRGAVHIGTDDGGAGAASLAWAERRGFVDIGRETVLALDLADAGADEPPVPAGVTLTTWAERPELAPGLYAIACEGIPDIPGEEDTVLPSFEEWLRDDMSGPSDRPEAVTIALAGGEAVGFAKLHLPAGRPDVARHDLAAVRRAWRGRGIARALKGAQIAWAREQGYRRLEAHNEERNAPIRALNTRFGYRPAATLVRVQSPRAT